VELRAIGDAGHGRPAGRRPGALTLAACLFTAAAIFATAPAIGHAYTDFLAAGAPGHGEVAPGDHLQTAYRLWLPGHQIERLGAPWRDPYSFRPEAGPQLNPAAWPFGLVFWPLWRAFGIVIGWNILLLLGLAAAGLVTYLWLRELEIGVGAALTGGLVFELAPYRLAQSSEHLLGLVSVLLPLSLWALERARHGSRWWLLCSAGALVSIPASGQLHFAMGAVVFMLAYALVRAHGDGWQIAAALTGVAIAIATGILLWTFTTDGTIADREQPLRKVGTLSADWIDFLSRNHKATDTFVFLGWLTPLVALAGLATLLAMRRYGLATVLGLGAVLPMVLALGTSTPVYEATRFVVVPLRYVSAPGRLMPVAGLAIAALVAFAIDELSSLRLPVRVPRKVVVLPVLAAILLVADVRVPVFERSEADQGNGAYVALRAEPPGRVLELPVLRPDAVGGSAYLYYTTQARRERPLGYSSVAPSAGDDVARALAPLDCGDWTPQAKAELTRLGVRSIVFHAGLYRDNPDAPDTAAFAWRALNGQGYRPDTTDGAVTLFTPGRGGPAPPPPVDEPPPDTAVFCTGWGLNDGNGRRLLAEQGSLWAYSEGGADLRLVLSTKRPATVMVAVDGKPTLSNDLSGLAEVRVPVSAPAWHRLTFEAPREAELRFVAYALG
jgi:hypothetical protein